jgi:Cdc6-like AAA superfamily ATPase
MSSNLVPAAADGRIHWEPDYFRLPVHAEIEHQMRLGLDGVESGLVIGARGVGKTYAVRHLAAKLQAEETSQAMDKDAAPRTILYYEASAACGAKTALIDLWPKVTGRSLSPGACRSHSADYLIDQIARRLKKKQVHLICVDEAQMIDARNLDLMRQIPDAAMEMGHRMAILYIGNESLRASFVEIKQLGQRIATAIVVPQITAHTISPHLAQFHADLGDLREGLAARQWKRLEEDLFRAVAGKFRRLRTIIANAHALSTRLGRPIDETILRTAIQKLSPEV